MTIARTSPVIAVALLLAACKGDEAPRPPSRHADAGTTRRADAAAPAPAPAASPPELLRHGRYFFRQPEPVPGRGLRLLFGGPPYRLCVLEDLAVAHPRAHCTDVATPPEESPARIETTGNAVALVRPRADGAADRLTLSPDRDCIPALVGDRALYTRSGKLVSQQVLSGETPFGPREDLGPVAPWDDHVACRTADGALVAVLHGQLTRMVPNAGRVDAPGPATVLFAGDGPSRVVSTELPARPTSLSCSADSVSMVWVRTSQRASDRRSHHALTRVRCTRSGCETTRATVEGFAAWNPPAVAMGDDVLLVRAEDREVRMRFAPLEALGGAIEARLLTGTAEPSRIELLPRAGAVGVLVDFPDRTVLFRIASDGSVTPVGTDDALPPLPDGEPRHGGG